MSCAALPQCTMQGMIPEQLTLSVPRHPMPVAPAVRVPRALGPYSTLHDATPQTPQGKRLVQIRPLRAHRRAMHCIHPCPWFCSLTAKVRCLRMCHHRHEYQRSPRPYATPAGSDSRQVPCFGPTPSCPCGAKLTSRRLLRASVHRGNGTCRASHAMHCAPGPHVGHRTGCTPNGTQSCL